MDAILAAHKVLESRANLSKAVDDVQVLIDQLQTMRDSVAADQAHSPVQIAKMRAPIRNCFDQIEDDLKEINKGLNQYSKALKDKFKAAVLPTGQHEVLKAQPGLVDRAIEMHLLREGSFDVARTFATELRAAQKESQLDADGRRREWKEGESLDFVDGEAMEEEPHERTGGEDVQLQRDFTEMYVILDALRNQHDLSPAMEWARRHCHELEKRGSNLEFELARLKFVELYMAPRSTESGILDGPTQALAFAQEALSQFNLRYLAEISSLLGSLAYSPSLESSPYRAFFFNQDAWEQVSISFTREFCATLGLSPQSPLYTAVTAGGIALPVLEKFERVMAQARGQWTSVNELPVETPLPPSMQFHSIFVCPVSKEQATDANPPMMMTCGHVIAKESLEMHSRGKSRMKCPYCPNESLPREAKRLYIG